jgi:hypothetical protein
MFTGDSQYWGVGDIIDRSASIQEFVNWLNIKLAGRKYFPGRFPQARMVDRIPHHTTLAPGNRLPDQIAIHTSP